MFSSTARAAGQAVGCAPASPTANPAVAAAPDSCHGFQQPRPLWVQGLLLLLPGLPGTRRPRPRPRRQWLPHPATAAVSSMACAAPHSTSCARCPASSRRRSWLLGVPCIVIPRPRSVWALPFLPFLHNALSAKESIAVAAAVWVGFQ